VPVEEVSPRKMLEQKRGHKHEQRKDNRNQRPRTILRVCIELPGKHLHAVLQIDPSYVETKRIAREKRNIFEKIADWGPESDSRILRQED
jgi:hypothetical protein